MAQRRPPDSTLISDQLEGQKPNIRASHAIVTVPDGPDGGSATVAINRRESPLLQLFHGKQIDEEQFGAALKLRGWYERSYLHGLQAQGYEIIATGSSPGERVPAPGPELCAMAYTRALKALSLPRLALLIRQSWLVFPGELLHALLAEHQGIRELETRYRLGHGSGTRRIRASLNLLVEYLDGQLEVRPIAVDWLDTIMGDA